jgi:predicted N-acyltransferase
MVSKTDNCSFIKSIEEISKNEWNECTGLDHPFTRYEFIHALEKSGSAINSTGWQPFHYIEKNKDKKIIAICPLYIKSHSFGEYIFDHAWADAYARYGLEYYPKLQSAIPFTPVTGERIIVRNNIKKKNDIKNKVIQNIIKKAINLNLSSVHFNFLKEPNYLNENNKKLLLRKGIQFHWKNNNYESFDDFLKNLSSRKRKLIKKERSCIKDHNLEVKLLNGNEITNKHWDFFYECYLITTGKKWGSSYLTKNFFNEIGKHLASKILLIVALKDNQMIASALNFISDSCLYGRLWGTIKYIPYLHFELCYYQAIDYAIKNKIKNVEAGAQGSHKLQRGYLPKETYSLHWIKDHNFKNAINNYLNEEMKLINKEKKDLEEFAPYKKN